MNYKKLNYKKRWVPEWLRFVDEDIEEERCLIKEFFKRERQKPPAQRSSFCMISCPCPSCSVSML